MEDGRGPDLRKESETTECGWLQKWFWRIGEKENRDRDHLGRDNVGWAVLLLPFHCCLANRITRAGLVVARAMGRGGGCKARQTQNWKRNTTAVQAFKAQTSPF
jgi:hypothetical protein